MIFHYAFFMYKATIVYLLTVFGAGSPKIKVLAITIIPWKSLGGGSFLFPASTAPGLPWLVMHYSSPCLHMAFFLSFWSPCDCLCAKTLVMLD